MNYAEQFAILKGQRPEFPNLDELNGKLDRLWKQSSKLWNQFYRLTDGKLVESNEPKFIIKIPTSAYQKQNFNENYTFAFQSLIDGRKSTFIKYSDRETLGILDEDRQTGGVYPDMFELESNVTKVNDYYTTEVKKVIEKRNIILDEYRNNEFYQKQEWKDLYHDYLLSPEWKAKRAKRLAIDNFECYYNDVLDCDCATLHVHHISYENIGNEKMSDLITLCENCHNNIHRR